MLEKLKNQITLPVAIVLAAGGVCYTVITIFAPAESHQLRELLFGANGLFFAYVASRVAK